MNGNYLVILVSVTIILPLALMKQLGKVYLSSLTLIYEDDKHFDCPMLNDSVAKDGISTKSSMGIVEYT